VKQRDALLALAARCEAEGPSRELDCYIHAALIVKGAVRVVDPPIFIERRYYALPDGSTADWIGYDLLNISARYTTSLDAAVTLIVDGVEWSVSNLYHVARAEVGLNLNGGPNYGEHKGALMALALCAAALRARAEEGA